MAACGRDALSPGPTDLLEQVGDRLGHDHVRRGDREPRPQGRHAGGGGVDREHRGAGAHAGTVIGLEQDVAGPGLDPRHPGLLRERHPGVRGPPTEGEQRGLHRGPLRHERSPPKQRRVAPPRTAAVERHHLAPRLPAARRPAGPAATIRPATGWSRPSGDPPCDSRSRSPARGRTRRSRRPRRAARSQSSSARSPPVRLRGGRRGARSSSRSPRFGRSARPAHRGLEQDDARSGSSSPKSQAGPHPRVAAADDRHVGDRSRAQRRCPCDRARLGQPTPGGVVAGSSEVGRNRNPVRNNTAMPGPRIEVEDDPTPLVLALPTELTDGSPIPSSLRSPASLAGRPGPGGGEPRGGSVLVRRPADPSVAGAGAAPSRRRRPGSWDGSRSPVRPSIPSSRGG